MNLEIFRAINRWPESWSPFWRFFSEAANHAWVKAIFLILLVGMVAYNPKTRWTAILAIVAVLIANFTTDLWKHGLPEHRPFQDMLVSLRAGYSPSMGTASAHAANMAAVATVFLYRQRWWGLPWLIVALLTGISRIYVGVHYPYQVLLGWTCGGLAGLASLGIYRLATRKKGESAIPAPAKNATAPS